MRAAELFNYGTGRNLATGTNWCSRYSSGAACIWRGEWNELKWTNHFPSFYHWLVVWTPLKNISQLGWLSPIYGKIRNVPNHQPDQFWRWQPSGQIPLRVRVKTFVLLIEDVLARFFHAKIQIRLVLSGPRTMELMGFPPASEGSSMDPYDSHSEYIWRVPQIGLPPVLINFNQIFYPKTSQQRAWGTLYPPPLFFNGNLHTKHQIPQV